MLRPDGLNIVVYGRDLIFVLRHYFYRGFGIVCRGPRLVVLGAGGLVWDAIFSIRVGWARLWVSEPDVLD